jgi:hypothetical protein
MTNLTQKSVTEAPKMPAMAEAIALPGSKTRVDLLRQEGVAFTRYLIGQPPDNYVLTRYRDAHRLSPEFAKTKPVWFDTLLLRLARLHPAATKVVDSYTAAFYKESLFSKKMVLLVAILESSAANYSNFDPPPANHPLVVLAQLSRHVLEFGLALLLGVPVLLPLQLVAGATGQTAGGQHHG